MFEKLMVHNNPDIDVVSDNENKKMVKLCLFIVKVLSNTQILSSIKGCNSVANVQIMMLYNPNVDLVNDNVYTKFG